MCSLGLSETSTKLILYKLFDPYVRSLRPKKDYKLVLDSAVSCKPCRQSHQHDSKLLWILNSTTSCYRPQTKFAKVIFLHLSVSHSVHGGGLPQCMLGYTPPTGADTPHVQYMLGDMGNKRAVCILLEYIPVTACKRSLGQGNVFTHVCRLGAGSTYPWGFCLPGGFGYLGESAYGEEGALGRPPPNQKSG